MTEPCRAARYEIEEKLFDNDKTSFFPTDQLRRILDREKVLGILSCRCRECVDNRNSLRGAQIDPERSVDDIRGGPHGATTYFGVFGLLIVSEFPALIFGFLRKRCNDEILEAWTTHEARFSEADLKTYTGELWRFEDRFKRFMRKFAVNLPRFAVPHMQTSNFRQYHGNVVLPFIEERVIGLREGRDGLLTPEGANGTVFAFKMHPEYCRFPDIKATTALARKQITERQPFAYLEQSNIEYVQRFKHDHIVKLIKAFGHGTTINFIFPLAWTNLDHLLRDQDRGYRHKRGSRLETADAWKQLLGIAQALKKIQGFADGADSRITDQDLQRVCIHFDLKPDNILVESEDGNWVITDFGSAALAQQRRGRTTPAVNGHFGTDAYAPPEYADSTMHLGRAYDIWSLGCIFLEVTAFMVLGHPGIKSLDQARRSRPSWMKNEEERFFCQERPEGDFVVKPEVRKFISNLGLNHANLENSSRESVAFLRKVLDLINWMLQPDTKDRPEISLVVQTLSNALKHAESQAKSKAQPFVLGVDERVLGDQPLNELPLVRWSTSAEAWEGCRLVVLGNEAGYLRLHCRSLGNEPTDMSFRRGDVKILPYYAFWDPNNSYSHRTWLDFSFLSEGRRAPVANAMLGFEGNDGVRAARKLQSTLSSQDIVASYDLQRVAIRKPSSFKKQLKGFLSKKTMEPGLNFGSATIQIWVERDTQRSTNPGPGRPTPAQSKYGSRPIRILDRQDSKVPTCRVAIYLHQQGFICLIRIDSNWVQELDEASDKILTFQPHASEKKKLFYASWLYPTAEEASETIPAGVPLSPQVLQYFEDLECFETENIEVEFLNTEQRQEFKISFLNAKESWYNMLQAAESVQPVNRMAEGGARLPPGVGIPPVPTRKAALVPIVVPRPSISEAGSADSSDEGDVKAADKDGRTPLHEAARSSSEHASKVINNLVRRGADVKAADKDGRTPLHEAARSGSKYASEVIYDLVRRGADVKAADKDGRTPLHEAARSGSEHASEVIRILVDQGVDVKTVDKDGRTSLHEAARSSSEHASKVINNLVRRGADVKGADKDSVADPIDTSVISLESIIRFLGFAGHSPESVAVTASCSDNEADTILLLQLGVDPILVSKEWRSRHGTIAKREMPLYLTLWEESVIGREYGTIKELINEITADHHVSFDSITWQWELPVIPASDMESDVVLVVTNSRTQLTGHFGHVHASTYQDYLKQCRWADFIVETLDILTGAELDSAHGGFSMYAMTDPPVSITCSHTNLLINFGNKQTCLAVLDLVEALDWLCKSMRSPTNKDGHVVSSASYFLERCAITQGSVHGLPRNSTIQLHTLRPCVRLETSSLPEIEHNCWLSFFDSCVIVESPVIPNDGFGKGLETSFDLMIALAASEFCLKINSSFIFLGYQTVLYPVAIDGNCAQFHLISITHGQINPYTLDLKNILPVDDSSQFKTMRCFVGWCEVAHINLGTHHLAANVRYSGGRDQPKSLESDGYALLGQFGASAPLSAIGGIQKNFKYSRHRIRFTHTKNYLELLQDASQQSVVLYDAKQRRCWLVPKLSLLLHMSQIYTSCSAAGLGCSVPYAEPHTDAVEIIPVLEPAGETSVLAGQATKLLFQEFLLALSIRMLNTAEAVRESGHGSLYGFEFMDVVRDPDKGPCMKRLDIQSKRPAWLNLVNAVGTVIVCSDLGEAISAAEGSTRKCTTCNRVPQSKDYFTATLPCLSRLAEQRGVDLKVGSDCIEVADKAVWKLEMDPFIPCIHEESSNETCWERPGLIQQVARLGVFYRATLLRRPRPRPAQQFPAKGAVVFG